MARLTQEQWTHARQIWEADPREGYQWLINQLGLPVSKVAVLKRAQKEFWAKKASLKSIVEQAQTQADNKEVNQNGEKLNALTVKTAVDLRANILETHRSEWQNHREHFPLYELSNPESGLNLARIAKTAAEAIKLRQEGERKAWGLDVVVEDTGAGAATFDELDAMFKKAMQQSQAMQDAMQKDRQTIKN